MSDKMEKQIIGHYEIIKAVTGGSWKENSYLVLDHKRKIRHIIDPGYSCYPLVQPYLDEPAHSDWECRIIITHPHHDHLAGANEMFEKTGKPCIIHPEDKRVYMHVSTYALRFTGRMLKRPENVLWLDETMEKLLQENGVKVINTPGHTSGSVCYDFGEFIFTGDTLLKEKIGRTDLPGSDRHVLEESIGKLTALSDKVIFPGHGEQWEIKEAKAWWGKNVKTAPELNTFM